MTKTIMIIAPEPPPFGGMANQAKLLTAYLQEERKQVVLIPTNKVPKIFSAKIWTLPILRTCGKFLIFIVGILKSVNRCSAMHILACSNVYFFVNVIPAVIIGRFFSKAVVINYRGGEAGTFFKGFARYFLWVFRLADSVIVPSGFLQSVFQKLGIPTQILPNISEIERFHFSMPDYSDHIKFISTRNFEPYYDILTIVRSFALVKKALPKASLTLIGEGTLKEAILDFVAQSGLDDSVSLPGRIEPHNMPAHLGKHDIYVNSSVVDNYPISLLEAFSSGLPVVSTAAGGIPYMVEHGKTGMLVPAKDHKALANEMIHVAKDLDLGRKLAVNAKRFANEHSWEKIWPKLKEVYNLAG